MDDDGRHVLIGVVGVCGSGKSTLAAGLRKFGINIRHIAQEHSYVADMWQRLTHPDFLIFLDASYATTMQRRNLNWLPAEYQEQQHRLRHARQHAHYYVDTNLLTADQVLEKVIEFLREHGIDLAE